MRKARSDSALKVLPDKKQEAIIVYMHDHSLDETVAYCSDTLGVKTSRSRVSEFFSWWHVTKSLTQARDFADQLRNDLKTMPNVNLDDDAVMRIGQKAFELQAVKTRDAKLFIGLRKLNQSERVLKLEKDKFEFDAAKACLKALPALKAIATDKGLDENERLNAVREKLFGDLPE